MNKEAIESMQFRLNRIQSEIVETINSKENEVEITINGKMEILQLKINKMLLEESLEAILKETFNHAIKHVSMKLQIAMLQKP